MKLSIKTLNISAIILTLVFTSLAQTYWEKFTPSLDAGENSEKVYFEKKNRIYSTSNNQKPWTKIIVEEDKFSYSMPSDFLVYKKRHDSRITRMNEIAPLFKQTSPFLKDRLFWQIGFDNGVRFDLKKYLVKSSKKILDRMYKKSAAGYFKQGDFYILAFKPTFTQASKFSQKIYIGKRFHYYEFVITSDSSPKSEFKKFLLAIKINGKRIFKPTNQNHKGANLPTVTNSKEKVIYLSKLKTSKEIKESLDTKRRKLWENYQVKSLSEMPPLKEVSYTRPPIILFPSEKPLIIKNTKIVKIRVQLLASNQIGDVIVYSNADETMIKRAIKIIQKIEFVPAEINGKRVNSVYELIYTLPENNVFNII